MFKLRTVRRKLLALVALSVVVTAAMVPLLSWLMRKQLLGEVKDRVRHAQHAYSAELDDHLTELRLAATVISTNERLQQALETKDTARLERSAKHFSSLYPDMDIVYFAPDGTQLAQVGCNDDSGGMAERNIVKNALAGQEHEGISGRGCNKSRVPTYMIVKPTGKGAVIVGQEFGQKDLDKAGTKLDMELAMVDPKHGVVGKTSHFPAGGEDVAPGDPVLRTLGGRTYVLEPFYPPQLKGRTRQFTLVAAMDVTDVQAAVRRNMLIALGAVLLAALLASLAGLRLANVMSSALKRVSDAHKKLEQHEYVKVEGVHTGDELEDLASGFNHMIEGLQERDKLRTTFGKYMTEAVVEHLMAGKVQLGGVSLKATILFSDIRSFTTISEKMDAAQLVAMLNEYFTEMVAVVMKEQGVVDKYIGDAIMAVFGAPVSKEDDALHALRAAVGMRKALERLNERLVARGQQPIRTGIGLHTGVVIAGNIGSEQRMEYTVIGDVVNLASRLEGATKELGVDILISEDTYVLVKDHIEARPVRSITVKGRVQSVMTYEVLGLKDEADASPGKAPSDDAPTPAAP